MKIKSLILNNFRSYYGKFKIDFESDITLLLGKNDVGKSSILEALDIFFSNGKNNLKVDETDTNVNITDAKKFDICVIFDDLPKELILDTSVKTNLKDEYLLNKSGDLEIRKTFDFSGPRMVQKTEIRAYHPTHPNCNDLLLKKNAELKRLIKSEGINDVDLTKNSEMRKAVWNKYEGCLNQQSIYIDASKEDAKKIIDKLSNYFPIYFLFQADRKNSDGDSEVQDPLKAALKVIIDSADIQVKLKEIADMVRERLTDVSQRTLEKLCELDAGVSQTLTPSIPESGDLKWADVFKSVSITGDNQIPINKRGSGVRRLILLSFFRAEAEKTALNDRRTIIYAIEEPETSQHINNQILLINSLKQISVKENNQVILTTHSPVIVNQFDFNENKIRTIIKNESGKRSLCTNESKALQYPSITELIYLAFDNPSREYHNELYDFLEFKKCIKDLENTQETRTYIRVDYKTKEEKEETRSLTRYIRDQIHHPENKENPPFTETELKQSIDSMRGYINKRKDSLYKKD